MGTMSLSTDNFLPIPDGVTYENDVAHATELLHVVRNELALPRVKALDESHAHKTLRAIQALAHGSCGDLPGATAREVRDALVLDEDQAPSLASLVALLGRRYSGSTRRAAAHVIHALATPDVDVGLGGRWAVATHTTRQHALGREPNLVEHLVSWLQQCVVRHEAQTHIDGEDADKGAYWRRRKMVSEPVDQKQLLRKEKKAERKSSGGATAWKPAESELCLLLCQCLRSLCVNAENAERLSAAGAVPPLLTVLRHAPPDCLLSAAGCLIPISIWQPKLITIHGGVPLLTRMLSSPLQPLARLSAVQILAQLVVDEADCGRVRDANGFGPLLALALDGRGGRRNRAGSASWERHTRDGAIWCLARVAAHAGVVEELFDNRCRKAVLHALAGHDDASLLAREAAIMLLLKLGAIYADAETETPGSEGWRKNFAYSALPLIAACFTSDQPEPVRAQAAKCAAELYVSDAARQRLALGQDLRTVEMTSETDFGSEDYLEIVYGKDSAEAARRTATAAAKTPKARRGGFLQVEVQEEQLGDVRALEKKKRKYRGPPSSRLIIFDEEECDALANAPMKPGLSGRLVSVLENVSVQRKVAFDGTKLVWETRDKASGQVATCIEHNKRVEEFDTLQNDPARLQEAIDKARRHNKRLNPLKKRMQDPTVRKDLKDGLDKDAVVPIPASYRELSCGQITACHTASVEYLALAGVPETAEVHASGCFIVRTTETAVLCECVPDRPKFGPPPVTAKGKRDLAAAVALDWIQVLLGLLEDEMIALGLDFDIAQFDPRAAAAAEARDAEAAKKHTWEGQAKAAEKDPSEVTPMKWEDWVKRSCHVNEDDDASAAVAAMQDDASKERAAARAPSPWKGAPASRRGHPNVLAEIWSMVLHRTSLSLVAHGCAALLSLISEPGVNAHVREHFGPEIARVPESLSSGIAAASKVLVARKIEILIMLKHLDLVEKNLFRLDRASRLKFRAVILNWRKHLGYNALSSATEGFDKNTLKRLQETFAEIDDDGSGYLSADELGTLFKKLRMPMSKAALEEVVDEVDVDGNGMIDFEEFLLVVKTMKNMKSVQSKLGVALAKGSTSGALGNFVGDATSGIFSGSKGLGGIFGPNRKTKMKSAVEGNRKEKIVEEIKHIDRDVVEYQKASEAHALRRCQVNGSWVLVCKSVYAATLDWGDGRATAEPLLQTLVANPHFVEALGFAKRTRGMAADRHAQTKYKDTLRLASTYQTLAQSARTAGLMEPRRAAIADDDGSDGSDGSDSDDDAEDDGPGWSYQEFEDSVVKLVRTFRGAEERAKAARDRAAANMERVAKKKPPMASRLRRIALGGARDVKDPDGSGQ